MNIQPIVEGYGEVGAVPVLLRRLCDAAGAYTLGVNAPIRRLRADLVRENSMRKAVQLARLQPDCGAILIIFDSDDDCPKDLAVPVQTWAQTESSPIPCFVVIPTREFESWFLATIESLRGVRGILLGATSHSDPDSPRGAAEELRKRMTPNRSYSKRADQPAFTDRFDMATAYRRCRSFRRMVNAFGLLAASVGITLEQWPPSEWTSP
jgi:Domain of unknown function (DUF4276)